MRISEKFSSMTFTEVDIDHQKEPFRILHIVILTYISLIRKISGNHIIFSTWKMMRASEKCSSMISIEVDILRRMT